MGQARQVCPTLRLMGSALHRLLEKKAVCSGYRPVKISRAASSMEYCCCLFDGG